MAKNFMGLYGFITHIKIHLKALANMIMPMKMLEESLNKKVALLLKDNRVLEGMLTGYDEYMNMVLSDAQENAEQITRKLGTVVIRGSNVVRIVSA